MEDVHGVEVSWVHSPKKSLKGPSQTSSSPASTTRDVRQRPPPPPAPAHKSDTAGVQPSLPQNNSPKVPDSRTRSSSLGRPSIAVVPKPEPATPPNSIPKAGSRRPSLLRGSSTDGKRSGSWISNISNKFSSSPPVERSSPQVPQPAQPSPVVNGNGSKDDPEAESANKSTEEAEPSLPSRPKESSFFSSLTRKLSPGQSGAVPNKVYGKGGMCERRVLNRDPNRERCLVSELDASRLRKVSFCVDVEIAGGPRYIDDDNDGEDQEAQKKAKTEAKLKERAEGETLKRSAVVSEEKGAKVDALPAQSQVPEDFQEKLAQDQTTDSSQSPTSSEEQSSIDRKKEKKKRSEEERKERKEKRRRRAEESGSVPVEIPAAVDAPTKMDIGAIPSSLSSKAATPAASNGTAAAAPDARRDRPTTDPVRIYRRCCQLRESPILKRITEQLMSPTCCVPSEPGVVFCLDLTGSRLQLADMVTLGDWLAVVPVKKLLLEDADLSDEGLRCILAGLLAAKKPEPTRRKNAPPKHREPTRPKVYQERSGKIEKLTLKNNPRITRNGWKHISLFLYMCRSIKAIDLSMIRFPDTLPSSMNNTPVGKNAPSGSRVPGPNPDAAETIYKCLSERLGGDRLEELILSECGLSSSQIRKIVDGAVICGVTRLGFAGNQLDDDGLEHVLRYVRSGVCGGLDLGCNDLRGKINQLADALDPQSRTPFWALSLAGCNLDSDSIKALFSALRSLPDFRFIDLSHNPDLCGQDNGAISLLRRYIGSMKELKRVHLSDVGMSAKQAIALADVLPEGPRLAHLSIMENPRLTALANAKDEADQEEACALYASLMAAVRVSNTLICIDIDVPSPQNSEVVKALAKQVVAYSLANMEQFAIAEATGTPVTTANAASALAQPYGGEKQVKEVTVPDVLMHLVGHVEGYSENHDEDAPAPDDDYIVGGTGVVKALQYVLGEKADDLRRSSSMPSTPTRARPSSSAGFDAAQRGKAKKMSKNLLDSARKIRSRLHPALVKEALGGDDMAYRRLLFLDNTLQSMIQRFEEEYPECRLSPSSSPKLSTTDDASSSLTGLSAPLSVGTDAAKGSQSDDDDEYDDADAGGLTSTTSRRNSDVSIASRALGIEEGHLHRLGQRMRRDIVESSSSSPHDPTASASASAAAAAIADDDATTASWHAEDQRRLKAVQARVESISGAELKALVEHNGWDAALQAVGANMDDLRRIQFEDPQAWDQFRESQLKARLNAEQDGKAQ